MRPEILGGPDTRVQLHMQRLQLVLDLGPGLTADLLADPLPVRGIAQRDHPAPAAGTGLVMGAGPAVAPVVEVDAVFAVAPAFGGAEGIRTPDPLHAMEVRYQLRYSPARP